MRFEEWWKSNGFINGEAYVYADEAWHAATAAEREACAKLCEEMKDPWAPDLYEHACKECAEAIRARNATPPKD